MPKLRSDWYTVAYDEKGRREAILPDNDTMLAHLAEAEGCIETFLQTHVPEESTRGYVLAQINLALAFDAEAQGAWDKILESGERARAQRVASQMLQRALSNNASDTQVKFILERVLPERWSQKKTANRSATNGEGYDELLADLQ